MFTFNVQLLKSRSDSNAHASFLYMYFTVCMQGTAGDYISSAAHAATLHFVQHIQLVIKDGDCALYPSVGLFIHKQKLWWQVGNHSGGPLAMAIYMPISLHLLGQCLNDQEATKILWFAIDSAAGGKLNGLPQWWEKLSTEGPKLGYHPNPSKA